VPRPRPGPLGSDVPRPAPPARPDARAEPHVFRVAELDRRLKGMIERATEGVHVEGEISGLRVVGSGHTYFTLKDERDDACIDCVMYRTAPARARRLLVDGARVVLLGRVTLYVQRGRLQLVADDARPTGRGALLEALEKLKQQLAAEGLFAPERKRRLPTDPRVIGVVTSGDGAAIHDIVKVAFRRGGLRILLARAPVQGASAAQRMARALAMLGRLPEVEAIIVGRGGGSAEDLAAFNDELLVRQVAASPVPVVSAVGHEIDVSLCDLAADARAATPSQAAEMLVPDGVARRAALAQQEARVRRALQHRLARARAELDRGRAALGSPERAIAEHQQVVDDLTARLGAAVRRGLGRRQIELSQRDRRLAARHPRAVLSGARAALGPLEVRLGAAARRRLAAARGDLEAAAGALDALSPLAVLGRGYAIATTAAGKAVRDAAEARAGDELALRLARGRLGVRVLEVLPGDEPGESDRRR
jgi:exodeoxyribonuclease VII large subunit